MTEKTDPVPDPAAEPSRSDAADPSTAAPVPAPPVTGPEGADLARRRFFRDFAGELFQSAATVVGAAQALQRASTEAASAILDPSSFGEPAAPVTRLPDPSATPTAPTGFRTPFREDGDVVYLIDQRKLPDVLEEFACRSGAEVSFAIRDMVIRGAPAIGQVAAIGLALTAARVRDTKAYARRATLRGAASGLIQARPTAVNLRWAVERMMARYEAVGDLTEDGDAVAAAMRDEADRIVAEATDDHGRLAEFGLALLPQPQGRPLRVLTHCNTGPLACGQFGTALGIVQVAHHAGRPIEVFVDETRPYLQGARLTTWELAQAGVPHELIPDVAAGYLLARNEVDVIIVGADRIAANGDTANKVGTYPLAVLAARHGVPFYVAAPISTVDLGTPTGADIPIEERPAAEVLFVRGTRIAPPDTAVRNPSFDVTPAELISAIVTDEGAITAPYDEGLEAAVARRTERRRAAARADDVPVAPGSALPAAPSV